MITANHTNIYKIADYSRHLKNLPPEDRFSRFGFNISDSSIDQLILNMCYNPKDHELWYARTNDTRVGWGHLAKNEDDTWELAVSVDRNYQRQGVGNMLIQEMLTWAKVHHVSEIYMHCIEDNRVIQHLAKKHDLKTRGRRYGERTATLEVPDPTLTEVGIQKMKEQNEIINEIRKLQNKLTTLWLPI